MSMENNYLLLLSTCPNTQVAEELAQYLIENNLAACVNIVPTVHSVYLWKGAVERSQETLLFIKTKQTRYEALQEAIINHHPYETPEIIALPIKQGFKPYLNWIDENVEDS